ncbi:protein SENSITIVE TO UV [Salix suchowensis]|nr:protein SENSITIVE TO UV [Salix suchowensis]
MKEKEGEGFEEWDADFLDQLIQVEELALSSQLLPSSSSKSPLPTTNLPYLPPPPQRRQHDYQNNSTSYSPPRELSRRPIEFSINNNSSSSIVFDRFSNGFSHSSPSTSASKHNAKDLEIDRLKRELGRASKHLTDLERDEQINSLYADTEEKYVDIHSQKKTNFGRECGVPSKDAHGISQHSENAKPLEDQIDIAYTSKAIGVQTERSIDFTKVELNNDLPSHLGLSETLLGIWGSSTSEQQLGRNLISKLFMACPTDFQVLFGCMSMNVSSKSSHAALQYHMCSFPTSEAAKVSHLFSVLTKINNGVLQLEALYRSLLDFCDVTHVAILSSSLHILLVFLKQLLSLGAKSGGDNIKIEGLRSEDSLEGQDLFRMISYETSNAGCSSLGIKSIYPKHLCKKRCLNADISLPLSSVNWVLLFEMMLQIAVSNTEECVILEAISIMNVILMSSNAQTETEKFGQSPVFESVAQLLRREAGLRVQKEALHLLFLLLNCSKLLSIFCSGCKEEEIAGSTNNKKNTSTPKGFSSIFVGLAECIACSGNSIRMILAAKCNLFHFVKNGFQDIELRKRAIIMLAFLASSGKSSFEIMVSHKLHGEKNFLMLILQVLVSEMNVKASAEPARSIKARTSLIREALILLNRLVSSAGYSAIVLRILTARRDMASLTIDVASRLSQEDQSLRPSDVNGHVKESEIVELGQVFKKRVFAYLGDKIS